MRLVLHHYWRSSSSWRVRWALAHKGVAYESQMVDLLAGEQLSEAHRARSPMALVPSLVVEDGNVTRALTESVAIAEWLEDTHPDRPLLPRDEWQRARVRQIVELVNAGTQPLQNLAVLRHRSGDAAEQKAWARHWIDRGLEAIERELAVVANEGFAGRFAVGDEPTLADAFIVPQLYNARRFDVDLSMRPRLLAVEKSALATEAAQASHPDRFQPR